MYIVNSLYKREEFLQSCVFFAVLGFQAWRALSAAAIILAGKLNSRDPAMKAGKLRKVFACSDG